MEKERDTFIVEDENGRELTATTITRMKIDGTNLEYLIYYIDDLNDNRDVPEEEKQAVYEAFTDSYNKAMQS